MPDYTMDSRDIVMDLYNHDIVDNYSFLPDDNGEKTISLVKTPSGYSVLLSTETVPDDDHLILTYSVYLPGDDELIEGEEETGGFKYVNNEQALVDLVKTLKDYL